MRCTLFSVWLTSHVSCRRSIFQYKVCLLSFNRVFPNVIMLYWALLQSSEDPCLQRQLLSMEKPSRSPPEPSPLTSPAEEQVWLHGRAGSKGWEPPTVWTPTVGPLFKDKLELPPQVGRTSPVRRLCCPVCSDGPVHPEQAFQKLQHSGSRSDLKVEDADKVKLSQNIIVISGSSLWLQTHHKNLLVCLETVFAASSWFNESKVVSAH